LVLHGLTAGSHHLDLIRERFMEPQEIRVPGLRVTTCVGDSRRSGDEVEILSSCTLDDELHRSLFELLEFVGHV
jgi:hypothetical protein